MNLIIELKTRYCYQTTIIIQKKEKNHGYDNPTRKGKLSVNVVLLAQNLTFSIQWKRLLVNQLLYITSESLFLLYTCGVFVNYMQVGLLTTLISEPQKFIQVSYM